MSTKSANSTKSSFLGVESTDFLASLATVPMLLLLVGGRTLTNAVEGFGQLSEEVFRGDRLPLLKFPHPPSLPAEAPSMNTVDEN
jgi:hypothetical protein